MVGHLGFVKIPMKWIGMNKPIVEFYGGPHDGLIIMIPELSFIIEDFVDCINYVAVLCPVHGSVTKNSNGRYIYEYVHE